jgi:hypothetical protein
MTENYGNLQPYIDRTSNEYIASAEDNTCDGVTTGVYGGEIPPNTFEELAEAIESVSDCGSDMRQDAETILGFISSLPNRDEIVRLLPYDPIDKHVLLALPTIDFIKDRAIVEIPEKSHRLKNIARFIFNLPHVPSTGRRANTVRVAGRDPFSPPPGLTGKKLFEKAREYEQDRRKLAGEI